MQNELAAEDLVETVRTTVREVLIELAGGDAIEDIRVRREIDFDGDDIFRIMVVVQAGKSLNSERLVGMVRHLRRRLQDQKIEQFPLMSYVDQREVSQSSFETL